MRWRVLGAVVVLAVLGVAAGYGVGALDEPEPRSFSTPAPLPAVSPAVPTVTPPVVVDPPDYPPLEVDLPDHRIKLPTGAGYPLTLRVPDGWVRTRPDPARPRWQWTGPDEVTNTYLFRVEVLAGSNSSPASEKNGRLLRLQEADDNGDLQELEVAADSSDTMTATLDTTYIDTGGYRRVEFERWVALTNSSAYATVAVIGREADRAGLEELVEEVTASLEPG